MATGQLASPDAFAEALRTYGLSGGAARALSLLVPVVELATAAGLLGARVLPRTAVTTVAAGGLAVAVFWSALAAQAFLRGLTVPNCGCFGAYLAQDLRWWVLLQDAYMLALAGVAARSARRATGRGSLRAAIET